MVVAATCQIANTFGEGQMALEEEVKRLLALGLLVMASQATIDSARAQEYPVKPIKIIVPFAPGSATDIAARLIGNSITKQTGQSVIVENKPGAEGQIGAQAAALSAPDGYTVMITTQTTQASNVSYKSLPYDPVKSFVPVTAIARGAQILLVRKDFPATSVRELIGLAKQQPGKITFGSGNGSSRAGGELFKMTTGVDLLHVPYKSQPQVITDLVGGRIDVVFSDMFTGLPPARDGRVKALAVTSSARLPNVPDLPTIAEEGAPGYEMWAWTAAYVPARTSRSIVERLNRLVHAAVAADAFKTLALQNGTLIFAGTPEELAAFQTQETIKWKRIVEVAGMQEP